MLLTCVCGVLLAGPNSPMLEDLLIDPASKRDTIPVDVIQRSLKDMAAIGTKEGNLHGWWRRPHYASSNFDV